MGQIAPFITMASSSDLASFVRVDGTTTILNSQPVAPGKGITLMSPSGNVTRTMVLNELGLMVLI